MRRKGEREKRDFARTSHVNAACRKKNECICKINMELWHFTDRAVKIVCHIHICNKTLFIRCKLKNCNSIFILNFLLVLKFLLLKYRNFLLHNIFIIFKVIGEHWTGILHFRFRLWFYLRRCPDLTVNVTESSLEKRLKYTSNGIWFVSVGREIAEL